MVLRRAGAPDTFAGLLDPLPDGVTWKRAAAGADRPRGGVLHASAPT